MTEQHIDDKRLEQLLDELEVEKAPDHLAYRLRAIADEQPIPATAAKQPGWRLPKWLVAPAMAAAPLALMVAVIVQKDEPSPSEIEQARQELATAFAYIDSVGLRTGHEIQEILGSGLQRSVKEPLSEHLPFTAQSLEEENT